MMLDAYYKTSTITSSLLNTGDGVWVELIDGWFLILHGFDFTTRS